MFEKPQRRFLVSSGNLPINLRFERMYLCMYRDFLPSYKKGSQIENWRRRLQNVHEEIHKKCIIISISLLSPLWMFIKSFQKAPFLGPHPLFIRHYYRMNRKMAESWWGWKKNGRQLCLISERDAVQSGLNILKIVQFKGVAKINIKGQ